MLDLAVLTPAVLLVLMLLLGRLERWLDRSAPPVPPKAEGRRWRRAPRAARSPSSVKMGAGRRLLAHRPATVARRRSAAAVARPPAAVPRAARRHLLGGRERSGH